MILKINKVIIPVIPVLSVLSIILVFAYILSPFSWLGLNKPVNSIDNIIYGNDYTLDLTDQEKQWLSEHPVIRLGIDRAFPPFGSITSDNEYIGFSADFMRMIEYRLKIKFDIVKDAPWGETMQMAEAGELDMVSALVNTKARQKFLEFTKPFALNPTVIINNGLSNGYIGSIDKLNGKKVAIERGSYAAGELSKKYPEIELILVKNTNKALSLVESGAADAYVGNAVTANYLIKKHDYHHLSFSGQTEYSSNHSIGIIKGNMVLADIMEKALASISEFDRGAITKYWFELEIKPHLTMKTIVSIGSALAGALVLLMLWVFSLRKTQNQLKTSEHLLKTSERLLKREVEVDQLTGLGNRRKFNRLLEKQIVKSKATDQPFALFYLDLDRIKQVNVSLGHAVGDLLLIEASKRLKNCVDITTEITRVAGDEFMIILPRVSDKKIIEMTAECIKNTLSHALSYQRT